MLSVERSDVGKKIDGYIAAVTAPTFGNPGL